MYQQQPGQQPKTVFKFENTEPVTCDECKGEYFSPVFMIRKISALMSPNGQEGMMPVQMFQCNSCGHVNESFLPTQNQAQEEQNG